ncbi:zinc finger protein 513 isoform X1 [Nycticebus coucang]|uniref:zinc finger protein 513 isoform X1 n=1 Tax=Nycticebus coucang TaxID=9470 RepID=UPI00234CD275|nr:zinc finger protein 513 isoform X1 [Nycticebus coucang]
MPRRKQSHPQPVKCEGVKVDTEDSLDEGPGALVLESDLLLGQDLEFEEEEEEEEGDGHSDHIMGFERDSEGDSLGARPGLPYGLSDDESGGGRALSAESEVEESARGPGEARGERPGPACQLCGGPTGEGPCCGAGGPGGGPLLPPRLLYSCRLCTFVSHYSSHLKRHMQTHSGEKPFRCGRCPYASAQLVNLTRHTRTHTGEKPYRCPHCPFACSSLGNLRRHQRTHVGPPTPPCLTCGFRCCAPRPTQPPSPTEQEGAVPRRPEDALLLPDLSLHMPPGDAGFLPDCGQLPGEGEGLCKTGSEPLPELLFPWTCRGCGQELEEGEGSRLGAAMCGRCIRGEAGGGASGGPQGPSDKGFACSLCPFATHYPNHLARHMKTHSGEKPFRCARCPYASAHLDNLKRHQRVHTGEKPYKCPLCPYACGNLANLKRHGRIHSGDKPFQCSLCNYSCNQSMNLKRHMLRHTGEKPFRCATCAYTTGHWDNYKRHQKVHGHGGAGGPPLSASEGWASPHSPSSVLSSRGPPTLGAAGSRALHTDSP